MRIKIALSKDIRWPRMNCPLLRTKSVQGAKRPRLATREPADEKLRDDIAKLLKEGPPTTPDDPSPPSAAPAKGADVADLQVLLDRMAASPGAIDGRFGSNVEKALAAYREMTGQKLEASDMEVIQQALAQTSGDAFTTYEITPKDAAGPFIASVPADYGTKAKLDSMSFTSVSEMLAERFHMDEAYLIALNPDAVSGRPGTVIKVANTEATRLETVAVPAQGTRRNMPDLVL